MRGLMVLRARWRASERSWLLHSSAALTSHSGESSSLCEDACCLALRVWSWDTVCERKHMMTCACR